MSKMMFVQLSLLYITLIIATIKCESVMKLVSVATCPVEANSAQEGFSLELSYKDGKLSGKLVLPFPIDDDVEFSLTYARMTNGKWERDGSVVSGNFCDVLLAYTSKMAAKLFSVMKIDNSCPVPAGTYELKDFSLEQDDTDIPDMAEGLHYQVNITYLRNEMPLACRTFELKN